MVSLIGTKITHHKRAGGLNLVVFIAAIVIPVVPKLPAQRCAFLSSPFWTQFCNSGAGHTLR